MIDRRRFLTSIAAATALPGLHSCASNSPRGAGLRPDPDKILDVAEGLSYQVVSRAGDIMADGLRVPAAHDGMAAFPGDDGRIILVCNHELKQAAQAEGPFALAGGDAPRTLPASLYDTGDDRMPLPGGTTTTVWDPARGKTERQHLSLGGTENNCSGGPTPWGSWLSCEECFESPAETDAPHATVRQQRHGYVFEVPSRANGLVKAVPITQMGRFEHEGCAVHVASGAIYLTEDKHHGLLYRYLPEVPGELHRGGRLQALAIRGEDAKKTHNWFADDVALNTPMSVHWIDLDNVDPDINDLRIRGAAKGAAMFARGEGITAAGEQIVFTCTTGGHARLGQIFAYTASPHEGTPRESREPGHLQLIAESDLHSLLWNPDNLTMAPWGDLIVCEDTALHCGVVGVTPEGRQYAIADNAYSDSELAGACFSPDGSTLFVNIQYPGMTVAISGDWPV